MPHDKKGRLIEVGDHVKFEVCETYDYERKDFNKRITVGRVFSVSPGQETCNVSAVHLAPGYWPLKQETLTAKNTELVLKADGSEPAPAAIAQADGAGEAGRARVGVLAILAALVALALPVMARADAPQPAPSPRPLFEWGSFATTQTLKTAAGNRQIFGARVAGSLALPFGVRAVARVDFTGLPDGSAVNPSDPTTFQACDVYVGVHGPSLWHGLSPAAGAGLAFDIEGGKVKAVERYPRTYAGGLRWDLGHHSTVYQLVGIHEAAGPGVKSITAAHVFVSNRVSLVLDVVAPNGFQRLGVAYRIK